MLCTTHHFTQSGKKILKVYDQIVCVISKVKKPHHLVAILSVSRNRYYKTQNAFFHDERKTSVNLHSLF